MGKSDEVAAMSIDVIRRRKFPELNFRDVADSASGGSVHLRPGVLFRSACPEKTSVEHFERLIVGNQITVVVDLRSADEDRESSRHLSAVSGVKPVHIPFLKKTLREWENPKGRGPTATAGRYLEMIEASGSALVQIFQLLASERVSPVLIHCAAGRDRTGMVYFLLLAALGIDMEKIANDYAMSHDAVTDGYGAMKETIFELSNLIERRYHSIRDLLDRMGVSRELVERVRLNYRGEIA